VSDTPAAASDPDVATVRAAVEAVRRGDREAFSQVVVLYQRRLFGLALMMTRNAAAAEEVAQDAFVRAFLHLKAYDAQRPFYPWVSAIAVRLAQNWLVRNARVMLREGADLDAERDAPAGEVDALERLMTSERDRRLWRVVATLPSGERTAALLYYRQGLSVTETADALGVSEGTIKTLLFRARHRLRRLLGHSESTEDPS
jgi:RNA polymerase sigma-70 factor (ECF subfamily)